MCDSNSSLADLQAELAALEAEQEADNKKMARLEADKAARDARLYALRAQHEPETIFNLTALPPELLLCVLRECTTASTLAACAQVCILLRDAIQTAFSCKCSLRARSWRARRAQPST